MPSRERTKWGPEKKREVIAREGGKKKNRGAGMASGAKRSFPFEQ